MTASQATANTAAARPTRRAMSRALARMAPSVFSARNIAP
jgi:hypothetical protein